MTILIILTIAFIIGFAMILLSDKPSEGYKVIGCLLMVIPYLYLLYMYRTLIHF